MARKAFSHCEKGLLMPRKQPSGKAKTAFRPQPKHLFGIETGKNGGFDRHFSTPR